MRDELEPLEDGACELLLWSDAQFGKAPEPDADSVDCVRLDSKGYFDVEAGLDRSAVGGLCERRSAKPAPSFVLRPRDRVDGGASDSGGEADLLDDGAEADVLERDREVKLGLEVREEGLIEDVFRARDGLGEEAARRAGAVLAFTMLISDILNSVYSMFTSEVTEPVTRSP